MVRITILIGICVVCASGGVQARSYRVSPSPCPAAADAPAVVPDQDATLHASDIETYVDGVVIFDVKLDGPAGARLFKRFALDPRTGVLAGGASKAPSICE